ncbi:MAG: aromatic amino acid lyase [Pseudomonadota bacterium]
MAMIELNGDKLSFAELASLIAGAKASIAPAGLERMRASREVIERAVRDQIPVYGVTTGLGSNVSQTLSSDALSTFSLQTLRGRAHSLGEPLPDRVVRTAMLLRLHGLLGGASGASISCAEVLCQSCNARLIPIVGETASIGGGDLVWGATMGLALAGEGRMRNVSGEIQDARECLELAGIEALQLGPRDGLAMANHGSFSTGLAALGILDAHVVLANALSAAALSMLGFGANVSPLREDVLALCERPGETRAAEGLRAHLAGSAIESEAGARRLQDPLSIRNIVQIHGAVFSMLQFATHIVQCEINAASDNPVVLTETDDIVSSGGYHVTQLAMVIELLARSLVHLTSAQLARIGKLLATRFTDLPQYLADPKSGSNGFAPVLKPAEALYAEIVQLATPAPVWPSISADGVEDNLNNAPLAGKSLLALIGKWRHLTAIELAVAAQAVELRENWPSGPVLTQVINGVRAHVQPLGEDRPLRDEINSLAEALRDPLQGLTQSQA